MKYLLLLVFLIGGCSTGPGAPLLRKSADDGQGPMISGCINVSAKADVKDYITGYYLSTWDSAIMEGTISGAMEGAGHDSYRRSQVKQFLDQKHPSAASYCRAYNSNINDINQILENILPLLGNDIRVIDKSSGYFETAFIKRQHAAARWRDRYFITTSSEGHNKTIVRIFRELQISRKELGSNRYSPYIRARSVGHNEAWIMTIIARAVD